MVIYRAVVTFPSALSTWMPRPVHLTSPNYSSLIWHLSGLNMPGHYLHVYSKSMSQWSGGGEEHSPPRHQGKTYVDDRRPITTAVGYVGGRLVVSCRAASSSPHGPRAFLSPNRWLAPHKSIAGGLPPHFPPLGWGCSDVRAAQQLGWSWLTRFGGAAVRAWKGPPGVLRQSPENHESS